MISPGISLECCERCYPVKQSSFHGSDLMMLGISHQVSNLPSLARNIKREHNMLKLSEE